MLEKALRGVGQATKFKAASSDDYTRAFDSLIDMLDYWEDSKNLLLYGNRPTNIDSVFGSEDPVVALYQNLIIYIADDFAYDFTAQQSSRADDSLRTLRNRINGLPKMNRPSRMPRGSNNSWYNYYFLNSDGSNCSQALVTNNCGSLVTS